MSKIGRNDPCPCGSGKKYKKCCGASNVVEFNPDLYTNQLDQLTSDLLDFAVTHFESDLTRFSEEFLSPIDDIDDEEINTYLTMLSAWFILKHPLDEGQTIFQHFHAKQQSKLKYPRVKQAFSSWGEGQPGIFEAIDIEQSTHFKMTLRDIATEQIYQVLNKDDTGVEVGDFVLGLLVPYVNSHQFLFGLIAYPSSYEENALALLDNIGNADDGFQTVYPELLKLLLTSSETDDEDELVWLDTEHEKTAQTFVIHMTEKEMDDKMIHMGTYLWYTYCEHYLPDVRNRGSYAAALDYLIQINFNDNHSVTQSQLAKEYGVSSGTVSNNYRRLLEGIEDINDSFSAQDKPNIVTPTHSDDMISFNTEQELRHVEKLLADKEFDSMEEANEFLNQMLQDGSTTIENQEPRDEAQDLLYEASQTKGKKQKQLIEKALTIYPDSPDAYLMLADQAKSFADYFDLVNKAVIVGKKDLGDIFFHENKGYFWGLIETRPYMRAKEAYARAFILNGQEEEAIEQYQEMLELNPHDNQGIRDLLLPLYIGRENFQSAKQLIKDYEKDTVATFSFGKVLVSYLTNGLTAQTMRYIKEADENNPYVKDYLLERKKVPHDDLEYVSIGDETEAIHYAQNNLHLWADVDVHRLFKSLE